jgi:hydrogenase nickel incorporation protein HypA/HybF
VQLGALAGVSKAELQFGFDVMSAETPCAGARLVIAEAPAVVHCAQCAAEFALADPAYPLCPKCGTAAISVVRGKELILLSIEVCDEPAGG